MECFPVYLHATPMGVGELKNKSSNNTLQNMKIITRLTQGQSPVTWAQNYTQWHADNNNYYKLKNRLQALPYGAYRRHYLALRGFLG